MLHVQSKAVGLQELAKLHLLEYRCLPRMCHRFDKSIKMSVQHIEWMLEQRISYSFWFQSMGVCSRGFVCGFGKLQLTYVFI